MALTGVIKRRMSSRQDATALTGLVKSIIPSLSHEKHKGQAGRIGIVGGSIDYTGAPYYAAISALRVGCDLSHVFCASDAAVVIKSYSPELIVHPILDQSNCIEEMGQWLPRLHSLVIGPGLGRSPGTAEVVKNIIGKARERKIPIVIDADGLHFVTQNPGIVQGYSKAVLTPNIMEFSRLYEAVLGQKMKEGDEVQRVAEVSRFLGNVTITCKGKHDIITDGNNVVLCTEQGSPRRCGGQGDLLSGSLGVFTFWADDAFSTGHEHEGLRDLGPTVTAAYAACVLTRKCNRLAFSTHKRSMLTTDMVSHIQDAFEYLYV